MSEPASETISENELRGSWPAVTGAETRVSDSRRKVCHLIKGLGRGGAEALLPQTIRAGGAEFDYVVGYFLSWKDALVKELAEGGTPVRCFSARSPASMLARVPSLVRWLRAEHADLVHAHLPLAGVVGRLAASLAGVPLVYTEHNLQERYHPWTRRANLATWRLQAEVVAVSAEVADSIRRHVGSRVPVSVVRNGIEVRRRADPQRVAEVRRRFDLPAAGPVVGTVAVLRVQKRLDLWLEVARRVLEQVPSTRFLVVGDGPLRSDLEALVVRMGIGRQVRFAGLQEDVQPFLDVLDVYLMSSEFEGLPLALLEAMASGVAVVATAVGGVPEVIEPRREGLLVPFGETPALAEAVIGLLHDPARRHDLGAAGRKRVERDFGIDRMARQLEEIYARVTGRAG